MQKIADLVDSLSREGIHLSVESGQVHYRAQPGTLTPERMAQLRSHKAQIVEYLQLTTPGRPAPALRRRETEEHPTIPLTTVQAEFVPYRTLVAPQYAHLAYVLHFDRPSCLDRLNRSVRFLLDRHTALRSRFTIYGEAGVACAFSSSREFETEEVDIAESDVNGEANEAYRLLAPVVARRFDLERGPLLRLAIASAGAGAYCVLFIIHRAVVDNWSSGILASEFLASYAAEEPEAAGLAPIPLEFSDFVLHQREWLESAAGWRARAYWSGVLTAEREPLRLPTIRATRPTVPYSPASASGELSAAELRALRSSCGGLGATVFHAAVAGFLSALLEWGTGRNAIIWIGHHGRPSAQLGATVGCFADFWPLRVPIEADASFTERVQQVRSLCAEAQSMLAVPGGVMEADARQLRDGDRDARVVFNYMKAVGQPVAALDARQERIAGIVGWMPFHRYLEPESRTALA
ncbi:MAG: condensation domain-containing protein, partial [Steroidobacteraceae bacterium]